MTECWYTGWTICEDVDHPLYRYLKHSKEHLIARCWGIRPFWFDEHSHVVDSGSFVNTAVGDIPVIVKLLIRDRLQGYPYPQTRDDLLRMKALINDIKIECGIDKITFARVDGSIPWFMHPSDNLIELARLEIKALSRYVDLKALHTAYRMGYFEENNARARFQILRYIAANPSPEGEEMFAHLPEIREKNSPERKLRQKTINNVRVALAFPGEKNIDALITDMLHLDVTEVRSILTQIAKDVDLLSGFLANPLSGVILRRMESISNYAPHIISEICQHPELEYSFRG